MAGRRSPVYLGGNQLTVVPEVLGRLTSLRRLDLGRNRLTEFPKVFGELTGLQRLSLGSNQQTEIPAPVATRC